MKNCIEERDGCLQHTLKILGDKWSALIVRDLANKTCTFSDLEKSLECISPRTLSQRLDMLTTQQIVTKTPYCDHPPRYQYSLSTKGKELQQVLVSMADWGARYS